MSYLTQTEISGNAAMRNRVAAAAAAENVDADPDDWAYANRRDWAAAPGWDAAWESAKVSHPTDDPDDPNYSPGYDPGADEAVITDQQILAQVQAMVGQT